jgi:fatty acid desaturase
MKVGVTGPAPAWKRFAACTDERERYVPRRMKFLMAIITFTIMAFILGWGIVALMNPDGKAWLLVAGVLGYLVLFWRFGCTEEH